MSEKTKLRIAILEAITKQLWVKGLITTDQLKQMNQDCRKKLIEADC